MARTSLQKVCLVLSACFSITSAVQPLKVSGSHFVNSVTNAQFQIVGVDYQPGGQSGYKPETGKDPLSDGDICLRDAALMQQLGVNTVRVYNLSPSVNHDLCASIFNAVGIYLLVDVNSPLDGDSVTRSNPNGTYNSDYLKRIFGIVENFKNYPNTIGFFGANEIINDKPTGGNTPPFIRAVQRDLKNYIAKHSSRTIPVGYSAADVREILASSWQYLQCAINGDANDPTRSDFFGLNSYSWCGDSSFQTSGYDVLTDQFRNTSIPVFFSEYGCNKVTPRIFTEVPVLYGPDMAPVLSGGLVYEYSAEEANFGLVELESDGSAKILTDYDNLRNQYRKLNTTLLATASTSSNSPPKCDSSLITYDGFSTDFNIPSVPSGGQDLIDKGIPDAKPGKIVDVSKTTVTQKVTASNGTALTALAIKPLPSDQSNVPGGDNSAPKKKGMAGRSEASVGMVFSGLVAITFLFCLY